MLLGNVRDIGNAYLLEITEPKVFLFRRIYSLCLFRSLATCLQWPGPEGLGPLFASLVFCAASDVAHGRDSWQATKPNRWDV